MRRTSDSGPSVPGAVTITSVRPMNHPTSAAATSASIATTVVSASRHGCAVSIAMPSALWSSSASLSGLSGSGRRSGFTWSSRRSELFQLGKPRPERRGCKPDMLQPFRHGLRAPGARLALELRVLAQIVTHAVEAAQARIPLSIVVECCGQRVETIVVQRGVDGCLQTSDGGHIHRVVALQLAQVAERIRIGIPELGNIRGDAVERTLMLIGIVVPVIDQRLDCGLVLIDPNRRIRAATPHHECLQVAYP